MRCEDVRAELTALIRGELDRRLGSEVESHLDSCADCRRERDVLSETMELVGAAVALPPRHVRDGVLSLALADDLGARLRSAVPAVPPPALRDRVVKSATPPATVTLLRRPRVREALLAAAAVAALVFGLVSWTQLQDARDTGGEDVASGEVPRGHDMQVVALSGDMPGEATLTHYRHDNFRLSLSTEGYDVTPRGFQYAVWLRGEDGDVPLGGFRLKGPDDFTVPFAIAVDPARFPRLVVTLEPVDGNPALTGEIVSSARFDVSSIHHGEYTE